ncbi:MAG TPA: N-acetylmuramoyl-L-alanine amidase [Chloroflexia bacterium]|jgi:N-acetyl-anhydromuramyl-L-alanine amidase AmpD
MVLNIKNRPSPNCDSRNGAAVRAIVIHATAGVNSLAHLRNPAPGGKRENAVSAHDLIAKDGTIFHLCDYGTRAWHAGRAAIPPHTGDVNGFSIGIEIENLNDGIDPYPPAQMEAAVELVQNLVNQFGISRQFVVTHAACALPRGRKNDPQPPAFNMQRFLDDVFGGGQQSTTTFAVTGDGLRIRLGPGTDFDIVGSLDADQVIAVDQIVDGEDVQGETKWAHLADGRGYVTMRFLRTI